MKGFRCEEVWGLSEFRVGDTEVEAFWGLLAFCGEVSGRFFGLEVHL